MIKPSTITNTANAYIKEKLQALAEQHNIRILLAIESGSRAWGFPSQNSDYDVRFIYARRMDDYLAVEPFRDVIETALVDDDTLGVPLDLNGWDIKKALQLATKSNAVLIEWLTSPIRYIEDKNASSLIQDFSTSCADLQSFSYHYDRLAINAWDQIIESEGDPKLKLYCYALRPTLALEWIRQFSETPPMDVYSLYSRLGLSQNLVKEISNLISIKASANESDLIPRINALDEFIMSVLENNTEKPSVTQQIQGNMTEANILFRYLILNDI